MLILVGNFPYLGKKMNCWPFCSILNCVTFNSTLLMKNKCSNLGRARIELGTLRSEDRDVTNCTNHVCPKKH